MKYRVKIEAQQENAEQPAEQQVEQQAEKQAEQANNDAAQQQEEPDMWEETFKSHTDSKPDGKFTL